LGLAAAVVGALVVKPTVFAAAESGSAVGAEIVPADLSFNGKRLVAKMTKPHGTIIRERGKEFNHFDGQI
jgi:hypothetical protein